MELVNERLVDYKLYALADVANPASADAVEKGVRTLHEFYATLFVRFNALWVETNPRDVMAFPTIFDALKRSVRRELTQRSFKY